MATLLGDVPFEEFVNMDVDEPTMASFVMVEGVEEIEQDDDDDDDTDEPDQDESKPITTRNAMTHIDELIKFALTQNNQEMVDSAYKMKAALESDFLVKRQKQSKISDFFKK